jgi:CubicO group peptidase (beta-lactamase class C family)
LKNLLILTLLVSGIACNVTSQDNKIADESLQYDLPAPKKINKAVFHEYNKRLSSFFESKLLNKGFNGGILIAKNGYILYEKYTGKTDLRKPDPLTDTTAIHIASTSKTFTAMAVLRLVQENKMSLYDTLEKFFPGFPYAGITVKMLLEQRSGLPSYLNFMENYKWGKTSNGKWNGQYASNNDVLQVMYQNIPDPVAKPDTRFNYCNTNFLILANIIEKVSGLSYPEYIQNTFFGPLHMTHSYVFTLKDTLHATPSFTGRSTFWNYDFLDATYGDKNIYTTPEDLLKWDQALYTDQVVSSEFLDAAFTPYSFERSSIHNYGLGWRLLMLPNGKKVIYHFGKWHGCNAAFARLTDEKATIIILGNKYNRNIYSSAHLCYDFFGNYKQGKNDEEEENINTDDLENPFSITNSNTLTILKK